MSEFWMMVGGFVLLALAFLVVGIAFQLLRNNWSWLDKHVEKHSDRYKMIGVTILIVAFLWYANDQGWGSEDCTSFDARGCLD